MATRQNTRSALIDPVIAHIHVPKCGGTAFRELLVQHYGEAHLALYVPDTYFVYTEDQIAEYLRDRAVTGFSSHFVRTFPDQIAGRSVLYVTFLRSPVEQFISYITHVKKNFEIIPDKPLLSGLPPDPTKMSVREIVHWILTCEHEVNFHENYTVNFFARYSVPGLSGPFRKDEAYLKRRLSSAVRILDRFFFVGISEQMDQSVAVLRALMMRHDLDFPQGKPALVNTSFDIRDDLSWIHAGDGVGRLLLNSVAEDQILYEAAVKRFELQSAEFPIRKKDAARRECMLQ